MSAPVQFAFAAATLFSLGACAWTATDTAPELVVGARSSIAISVGPCLGFCPVYDVNVSQEGIVAFTGVRHTAVLGTRKRSAGPEAYRTLETDLARFRPAGGGTAEIPCAIEISDMAAYTITWIGETGQKTIATYRGGCREGPGHDLGQVLRELPQRLGIEEWMKQTTRPGESRG